MCIIILQDTCMHFGLIHYLYTLWNLLSPIFSWSLITQHTKFIVDWSLYVQNFGSRRNVTKNIVMLALCSQARHSWQLWSKAGAVFVWLPCTNRNNQDEKKFQWSMVSTMPDDIVKGTCSRSYTGGNLYQNKNAWGMQFIHAPNEQCQKSNKRIKKTM